jgi:hypothetical protein
MMAQQQHPGHQQQAYQQQQLARQMQQHPQPHGYLNIFSDLVTYLHAGAVRIFKVNE